MNVDAHLHVWDPERAEYSWLGPELSPIDRAVPFDEIAPTLARLGVDGVVLVQAADNAADTRLMLDTAAVHPEVVGVVAWVPLDEPDVVPAQLEALRENRLVRGIRNLFHARPLEWATSPPVDRGIALVAAADLTLDFVTGSPVALGDLPAIAERHPGLRLVIDHLGKPPIGGGDDERREWRRLLAAAAANPLTHAKLSGLYASVGALDSWTEEAVRPFVDDALELFGPDRLMWGSDWPIAVLAGGYERVREAIDGLLSSLSDSERGAILGDTARRFYDLDPQLPNTSHV
ncbi:MAG: amidohydrolase family protein [Pseudolysinimonas sp.]